MISSWAEGFLMSNRPLVYIIPIEQALYSISVSPLSEFEAW
jgi:hypothetical protein